MQCDDAITGTLDVEGTWQAFNSDAVSNLVGSLRERLGLLFCSLP